MDWFRSHHGAPTDPKWRVIAKRAGVRPGDVAAIVWALLDYASQHEDRGSVAGFDSETLAVTFDYDQTQVDAVFDALHEKNVIRDGRFLQWEKRQPKREDSSTERVRAFRKRSETQGNAPEKSREDTEQRKIPPKPPRKRGDVALSAEEQKLFDEWWQAWPNKVAKQESLNAFRDALRRAKFEEIMAGTRRYTALLAAPDPPRPKHPQGWLNGSRWTDQIRLRVEPGTAPRSKNPVIGSPEYIAAARAAGIDEPEPQAESA